MLPLVIFGQREVLFYLPLPSLVWLRYYSLCHAYNMAQGLQALHFCSVSIPPSLQVIYPAIQSLLCADDESPAVPL